MSRKKKFKRTVLCALLLLIPLLSMNKSYNDNNILDNNIQMCDNIKDTSFIADSFYLDSMMMIMKDSIKNELICEVERYVFNVAPRTKLGLPGLLVEHGLINDIDIVFMIAQTQLETFFGTLGAGRESSRHSLFGVSVKRYPNYDIAIKDYCDMLNEKYLVNGRTEKHLMRRYTTSKGARYAENPNYEAELTSTYKSIAKYTKIKTLQEKYKSLEI